MKVVKLERPDNGTVAERLRAVADMVKADPRAVTAWSCTLVYAEGVADSTYDGEDELALIGALDVTKARIVEGWE